MDKLEKEKLYTVRWYSKKLLSLETDPVQKRLLDEQIIELGRLIGDYHPAPLSKPVAPILPGELKFRNVLYRMENIKKPEKNGDKVPPFSFPTKQRMTTKGAYAKGWPLGAVVHFTAGRDGAEKTINGGIENGYTYWCIQKDGKLFTAHNADRWGYHAGKSLWDHFAKVLVGSVSDDLIGIEINNAGRLTKLKTGEYQSWFKTIIPNDQVRYTSGKDNQMEGYYEKYTMEQQETLINSLLWLKHQRPDVFDFDFVLGHDECAGMKGLGYWRKNDPGAALVCTMSEFREELKQLYIAVA